MVKERHRTNGILKTASAFFRPGGTRPRAQMMMAYADARCDKHGVEPTKADRPHQLGVSDSTDVSTWRGWPYVAFVIDVFNRRKVGRQASKSIQTDCVHDALEQALFDRQPERTDALIHHLDRVSRHVSIRCTERLAQAGIEPSGCSRADSDDKAPAKAINGLYKAELINRRGLRRGCESASPATLEWVRRFNCQRLREPTGYVPAAEAEVDSHQQPDIWAAAADLT